MSRALKSAPASRRTLTTASCPLPLAACKGVCLKLQSCELRAWRARHMRTRCPWGSCKKYVRSSSPHLTAAAAQDQWAAHLWICTSCTDDRVPSNRQEGRHLRRRDPCKHCCPSLRRLRGEEALPHATNRPRKFRTASPCRAAIDAGAAPVFCRALCNVIGLVGNGRRMAEGSR